jgi:hypothetical protein
MTVRAMIRLFVNLLRSSLFRDDFDRMLINTDFL